MPFFASRCPFSLLSSCLCEVPRHGLEDKCLDRTCAGCCQGAGSARPHRSCAHLSTKLCKPRHKAAGACHMPHAPGPNPRSPVGRRRCWGNLPERPTSILRWNREALLGRHQRSGIFLGGVDATPLKQAQPDLRPEKPRPVFRNQSNPG